MTNNMIDMTLPSNRAKVILLTAIHALTIELRTGMKMSRGANPLDALRRLGFTGRTKKAGLLYAIDTLKDLDPDYTPSKTVQSVLDSL